MPKNPIAGPKQGRRSSNFRNGKSNNPTPTGSPSAKPSVLNGPATGTNPKIMTVSDSWHISRNPVSRKGTLPPELQKGNRAARHTGYVRNQSSFPANPVDRSAGRVNLSAYPQERA